MKAREKVPAAWFFFLHFKGGGENELENEEGDKTVSQRSSNRPMVASVVLEIPWTLGNRRDDIWITLCISSDNGMGLNWLDLFLRWEISSSYYCLCCKMRATAATLPLGESSEFDRSRWSEWFTQVFPHYTSSYWPLPWRRLFPSHVSLHISPASSLICPIITQLMRKREHLLSFIILLH